MAPRTTKAPNHWEARKKEAGAIIRAGRSSRGWTQEQLAETLNDTLGDGDTVSQGMVSKWESGRSMPTPSKVWAIEQTLGIEEGKVGSLIYGPPPADPPKPEVTLGELAEQVSSLRQLVEEFVARFEPRTPHNDRGNGR